MPTRQPRVVFKERRSPSPPEAFFLFVTPDTYGYLLFFNHIEQAKLRAMQGT